MEKRSINFAFNIFENENGKKPFSKKKRSERLKLVGSNNRSIDFASNIFKKENGKRPFSKKKRSERLKLVLDF